MKYYVAWDYPEDIKISGHYYYIIEAGSEGEARAKFQLAHPEGVIKYVRRRES